MFRRLSVGSVVFYLKSIVWIIIFIADDWVIPKGAALVVSTFSMQRDPEYWEKPNSFYPEHFLPEAEAKRPNYAYIPFSVGQRGCIGKSLKSAVNL